MAAELDTFKAGEFAGKGRMLWVGETPWHRDGVKLTPDQQGDYEWVMKTFFDIPRELVPYWEMTGELDDAGKPVLKQAEDAFYVWRPDTRTKLGGRLGGDYEPVSEREGFEVLKPLIDRGVAAIETGGVLRAGADSWLMVKWDLAQLGGEAQDVLADEVVPFSTVMLNHVGRRGILIGNTAIRVVCANTLGQAEGEAAGQGQSRWATISHRTGAKVRLVEAAESLFSNVVLRYELLAKQFRLLKDVRLTDEQFKRLVLDPVQPDPREYVGRPMPGKGAAFNPESKMAGLVLERADRKRAEITRLWAEGKGHTGERSAWYALNAAVEALDHNRDLWPTRAGCYRTASLLTGELAEMKQRVTDRLVRFAETLAA